MMSIETWNLKEGDLILTRPKLQITKKLELWSVEVLCEPYEYHGMLCIDWKITKKKRYGVSLFSDYENFWIHYYSSGMLAGQTFQTFQNTYKAIYKVDLTL